MSDAVPEQKLKLCSQDDNGSASTTLTEFEKVASRIPVDRIASQVIRRGRHFEYELPDHPDPRGAHPDLAHKKIVQRHWESPPACEPAPIACSDVLIGRAFGWFTVVSYFGRGKEKTLWLCRCVCGHYETRYARAIKNAANADDCCERCRHLKYLKKHQTWRECGQ